MIEQTQTKEQAAPALSHAEIKSRLEALLATGMSRPQIALICDIHREALDKILDWPLDAIQRGGQRDVYRHDHTVVALSRWLQEHNESPEDNAAYAITPTFTLLQNLFSTSHLKSKLLAIPGPYGVGKSSAAEYYTATHARRHNQPGAMIVRFSDGDKSTNAALYRILDALASTGGAKNGVTGSLETQVVNALRPGDFLILDECQRVKDAMEIFCTIWERSGVGMAMLCNPKINGVLWGRNSILGPLASRVTRWPIDGNTTEDVDAWLAWKGLPPGLSGAQRTAFVKACVEIGTRVGADGGLRALAHVFEAAEDFYPGVALTPDFFKQLHGTMKPGQLK